MCPAVILGEAREKTRRCNTASAGTTYIGEVGGPDGVKLEDQVLVTEDGYENMVACPFDPLLMAR